MNLNTTLNGVEVREQLNASSPFSKESAKLLGPIRKTLSDAGIDFENLFEDQKSAVEKKSLPKQFSTRLDRATSQLNKSLLTDSVFPQSSPDQPHQMCGCLSCTLSQKGLLNQGGHTHQTQEKPQEFNVFNPSVDERGGRFGKWSQPGGKGTPSNITFSFANNLNLTGLSKAESKNLFVKALKVWSDYSPLNFQEIQDPGNGNAVDIRVEGKFIDGRSNVLGRAFSPVGGDITFDSGDTWSPSLYLETAVHEIGHALGLRHENGVDAIMNSSIKNRFRGQSEAFLLQDDINGIRSLYGRGKGSVRTLGGSSPTPPNPDPDPIPDPTPSNQNLLTNGGFETSSVGANQSGIFKQVQGWRTLRGPGLQIEKRRNLFGAASEGSAWVELDSSGNSAIAQNVDTITGQNYTLSFDYSPQAGVSAKSNGVAVYWEGKAVAKIRQKGGNSNQWQSFSFDVKGSGARQGSKLSLVALGPSDGAGGFIDNVVLKQAANVTADATALGSSLGTSEVKPDPFVDYNSLAQSFESTASSTLGGSTLGGNGLNPIAML